MLYAEYLAESATRLASSSIFLKARLSCWLSPGHPQRGTMKLLSFFAIALNICGSLAFFSSRKSLPPVPQESSKSKFRFSGFDTSKIPGVKTLLKDAKIDFKKPLWLDSDIKKGTAYARTDFNYGGRSSSADFNDRAKFAYSKRKLGDNGLPIA